MPDAIRTMLALDFAATLEKAARERQRDHGGTAPGLNHSC